MLILPAAVGLFKGYGQMEILVTYKGTFWVQTDPVQEEEIIVQQNTTDEVQTIIEEPELEEIEQEEEEDKYNVEREALLCTKGHPLDCHIFKEDEEQDVPMMCYSCIHSNSLYPFITLG